jgi:hypothetical protein
MVSEIKQTQSDRNCTIHLSEVSDIVKLID